MTKEKKSDWTIYGLFDPCDGIVRYVGKANNPQKRFRGHIRDTSKKRNHTGAWLRKLSKEGNYPALVILEIGDGDWKRAERHWIASFPCEQLTNHCAGGEGVDLALGPNGEITRKRMSLAAKLAWKVPGRKKMSPEARKRNIEVLRKFLEDPSAKARAVASQKEALASPDARFKLAMRAKSQWTDPEIRAKRVLGISIAAKKRYAKV